MDGQLQVPEDIPNGQEPHGPETVVVEAFKMKGRKQVGWWEIY